MAIVFQAKANVVPIGRKFMPVSVIMVAILVQRGKTGLSSQYATSSAWEADDMGHAPCFTVFPVRNRPISVGSQFEVVPSLDIADSRLPIWQIGNMAAHSLGQTT
jgi:hypothetical protein